MVAETYVGAIDQGTTGTRFMVFDRAGRVRGNAYERHEQHYPEPGWVEHDPTEIWENAKRVVADGLADADIEADQLAAIGIANQRETTLLWEAATGEPLYHAIVWQDGRTTGRVEELQVAGKADWIRETTGLAVDAYFSATKAEWLLENLPNARERAAAGELCLGTVDAWLAYKLTGNHVTDATNASRTMLFDVEALCWDDGLLAEFGVPRAALPEVHPSCDDETYGYTDADGFLGAAVPLAAALGDQQAALFGHTCFDAGDAKSTYGTGSFFLQNTGTELVESEHGLLSTVGFQRRGEAARYALEGSIFVTGAAVEWLADVGLIEDAAEMEDLARAVDSTGGVYFVPAFAGLGAPHWNGRARGTILGLTRATRREHLARATLEGICYRTRDVAEAVAADAGLPVESLRVDGGAVENDLLCQLQADALDASVVRAAVEETTALGAAYAAGLAVDYWTDLDELRANRRVDRTFRPDGSLDSEAGYERWREAVERATDWAPEG